MLTVRYTLRSRLVHLLGLQDTTFHHNVRQIGEEQYALIEAGREQGTPKLAENRNPDEQRIGAVAQHQLVPQMQDLVQREHVYQKGYDLLQ